MYAVLGRQRIKLVCFAALLFVAFILEGVIITKADSADIRNSDARLKYLSGLGIEVDITSLEQTEVQIPDTFGSVYKNYNELQKSAGFDLADYKGAVVTKYTYKVLKTEQEVYVNLLCYKGRVIGGDISSRRLDGFMLPLEKTTVLGEVKNGFNEAG
ncbi:MAG: DUF4830 domain-containing protein [Clostridia bacterium]|nr:DUF4830 domain-containing protein [Clostridia bacterium]